MVLRVSDDNLEKIRQIRQLKGKNLKSTPYLREVYVDEYEEERPVVIRDYQKSGIMNILSSLNICLGDATGIGKTLQVLSAIGYIWLKEPDFVPIIITKKSALFQWEAETKKFMKEMEPVTVFGQPFERDAIYSRFFNWKTSETKSLIIMTYDHMLKDGLPNVMRDRSERPSAALRKKLKVARSKSRASKKELTTAIKVFNEYMGDRPEEVGIHVKEILKPRDDDSSLPNNPKSWTRKDREELDKVLKLRERAKSDKKIVDDLNEEAAPSFVAPGILHYMEELSQKQPEVKYILVLDEIHTLKNYRGKMHEMGARIGKLSTRRVGLTATPIKNRLVEFFSIFKIIEPRLFPKITHFYRDYCKMKMQSIGKGRQVPIVVGHSNDQLERFIRDIEPYYLARQKHEVAKELPELITRELKCELSPEQEELYDMAEAGLLSKAEEEFESGAELLSALVLVQQASNSPELIADDEGNPFTGSSSKIDVITDLLQNELTGVKTIIFSRFEKMISVIERELNKKKIKLTRITGKENKAAQREANKQLYQDPKSGVDVILITLAGSESINLQATEHLVFVDSPWSYGDYVQLVGRAIRIGSLHKAVVATHLVAIKQSGKATIDDYVIKILRKKKKLSDRVSGVSLKDGLEFTEKDTAMDLFKMIAEGQKVPEKTKKTSKIKATNIQSVSSKKKKVHVDPDLTVPDIDFTDL